MTWVRLDDGFADHPKARRAGPRGVVLYIAGLCYSSRYLTDGFIPDEAIPGLGGVGSAGCATRVVEAGLWDRVDAGFQIPDYLDYNPSRAEILGQRSSSNRAAGGKARVAGAVRDEHGRFVAGDDAGPDDQQATSGGASSTQLTTPAPAPGTTPTPKAEGKPLAPTASSRARDPLFDALSEACGMNPFELTEREAKATGVALAQLRRVGATVEEIHRRAANYSTHFESAALTPNALATHWAKCAQPAQPTSPRPRPDPVMQRARRAADLRRQEEADDAREPDRGAHHALGS